MKIYPPWRDVPVHGYPFTVPDADTVSDLNGDIVNPQLVIFFNGNQFMVTPDLIAAFQRRHPRYVRIYWETLPPGVLAGQIDSGVLRMGSLRIALHPDIFTAGAERIRRLSEEKSWFDRIEPYTRNRLGIMVRAGNPCQIEGLADLGRPEVRVSMPDPRTEGIGRRIVEAFEQVGGQTLADTVMKEKVNTGTTFLTEIHHRQTPMRIMQKLSDAGPVWRTEALFQQRIGNPLELVEIPLEYNRIATYTAARLKDAPHRQAAKVFLDFLTGPEGQAVYQEYGFLPLR
jgi:molybdate transport system substrate-binding protein